jgi:hypothetical protein
MSEFLVRGTLMIEFEVMVEANSAEAIEKVNESDAESYLSFISLDKLRNPDLWRSEISRHVAIDEVIEGETPSFNWDTECIEEQIF